MSGWPHPEAPGLPLEPGLQGWHWLSSGLVTRPVQWMPVIEAYTGWSQQQSVLKAGHVAAMGWQYLGPCLKPTQIREAVHTAMDRARIQALEQAAGISLKFPKGHPARRNYLMALDELRAAILRLRGLQ